MKIETVATLRCPSGCAGALALSVDDDAGGRVERGELTCPGCEQRYPIQAGIPRLLPPMLRGPAPEGAESAAIAEAARKRSEMAARDAQAAGYDRMMGLALFGYLEIPVTVAQTKLTAGDVLLEAGCGTGRMTRVFGSRCRRLIALDYSWESLLACKNKVGHLDNVDLVQADVCALPFQTGAFTRAVSCQVLEHVPTPASRERMIRELARAVAAGGVVVLSAYRHSLFTRLFGRKEGEHGGGIYFYRFNRSELVELVSRALIVDKMTGALIYHYLARCRVPPGRKAA